MGRSKARHADDDVVYIDIEGQTGESQKAKFFNIGTGTDLCVPKSVIEDEGEELLGVKRWWHEKKEEEGVL